MAWVCRGLIGAMEHQRKRAADRVPAQLPGVLADRYGTGRPARHLIAVGSGKGGVGKSTVALSLALALVRLGKAVGILDADIYGPNIPQMVGVTRTTWSTWWTLAQRGKSRIIPLEHQGLQIASAGFIVAEDQPLALEGISVRRIVSQLMNDVEWNDIDVLLVDLPPGTGDVQLALLQGHPFDGAVIVVTPQLVAHLDARKSIQMYRRLGVPILGAIENMSGLICPHCQERIQVFPAVEHSRSLWAMGIHRLGEIPLEPTLAADGDSGKLGTGPSASTESGMQFASIARQIMASLNEK